MAKRSDQIKFRVTLLEKKVIENKATHAGLNTAEFCRSTALNKKIGYRLTEEEIEAYKMLQKYHRNFTAISNMFKKKDANLSRNCKILADEIRGHLKKFL